jgi:ribose transport system substrate-binding protein
MKRIIRSRVVGAVAAIAALAGAAAGCGSDEAGSSGGSSAHTRAVVATAKASLAKNYRGTDRPLPRSGPQAQKGKSVWVIPCSSAAAGCRGPADGAMAAGELLGWQMKLADGKLDPGVYSRQIRSAIAAGADGIVLVAVDCALTKGPLADAEQAKVSIFGIASLDCDDRYTGGKSMFTAEVQYGPSGDYGGFVDREYSTSMADYVIAKTDGKAKVIEFREDDILVVRHINDGFDARMKKCTTCKVWTAPFTGQDLVQGKLQGKAAAALTQHPDADVVMAPYDASILLGIGAAVAQAKASGRDLMLVGGEGLPPNVGLLKKGTQDFIAGSPFHWSGWAAIDGLNRTFAGEPQVDSGIGLQSIDGEHPLPGDAPYYDGNAPAMRYEQNYRRIWGVR